MTLHVIGVDLGQAQDYTAITVLECNGTPCEQVVTALDPEYLVPVQRTERWEGLPLTFRVRHLEKPALGTSYPSIVQRVAAMSDKLPGRLLAVDATGVGAAVVDLLEQAGLQPIAVTITGGNVPSGQGRRWSVPKRDLVGVLAVALQGGRLRIAEALPLAATFMAELLNFKVKIDTKTAHDSYEAWREGAHDDLVLAVAIAAWTATMAYSGPTTQVVTYYDPVSISPL